MNDITAERLAWEIERLCIELHKADPSLFTGERLVWLEVAALELAGAIENIRKRMAA